MRFNTLMAAVLSLPLSRLVYYYLAARAVLWAGVLHFTQPSKPLDVLEHLAWAREFQLVYEHHPGAVSWIVGALDFAGGGDSFLLSLPAPVAVSLAMLAVWLLARRVIDERHAIVAMLSLEGVWYFGVVAAEFNHNILQLAAWAFVVLAAHRAFFCGDNNASIQNWILLGIAAAFSLYAKYSSVILLAVLLLWSIYDNTARRQYRSGGVYLAFAVFALLTLPQVIALSSLDFSPFRFAISRAEDASSINHHFVYPIRFLLAQCGAVLLAVILCRMAINKTTTTNTITTTATGRRFVIIIAFAPLLLALLISALGGWRFKSHWGAPMLSFIPLAIIIIAQGKKGYALNIRRFIKSAMAVAALSIVAVIIINTAAPFVKERGKRIHYPGANIGAAAEALWQQQSANTAADTAKPLSAVVGALHLASLVSFYAPSRPRAVINGNWNLSYGVSREEFQQTGGIIIWTINDGKTKDAPPPDYAKEHTTPRQNITPATITLNWQTPANIPPLIIGIITIPPAE